jgi:septal ring factor EnvC (AmiA/AmiB activator)
MDYEISDYRVTDLEGTVRKLERQQSRFDDLDDTLDNLRGELESLQRAVDDNERTVRDQADELQTTLEKLESDIGDATRALSRLSDGMGWIERHIRASGAATEVRFDDQAGELAPLVRKITQGQQVQATLLTHVDRRQLEGAVVLFDQQVRRVNELTTAALQASATLTTTSYSEQGHAPAAQAFRAAFTTRQSQNKQLVQQRARAEEARTRLAQDDQLRNAHASTIRAGKAAAQTLRLRLRTTIAKALGEAALPPVWFTTALGLTPPRSGADEWLDIATEVAVYRITYKVTDPVVALGVKPDRNTQDQYRWHQELIDKLRRYNS